jgi:hypothetical protein
MAKKAVSSPSKRTKKNASPAAAKTALPPPADSGSKAQPPNNKRFILTAILVLLLLSGIQFLLLLTVTDKKLKPLDPDEQITIEVVQVIDLDYAFFSEGEFQEILADLERKARDTLGYDITFVQTRRVMSDEFADLQNIFIDRRAADAWFSAQLAVPKGWQTNFAWLDAILQRPAARLILESYYGAHESDALTSIIRQDFTQKISRNLAIRDIHGNRVFDNKQQEGLSSSAYWHYLLREQSDGDLVICNIPIFYPSALTTVDAITRGGLQISMIAPSSRHLGGVIGLSSWPVLAQQQYSRETARDIFTRMALQALARLLHRQDYALQPGGNLLSPILGEDYFLWYTASPGRLPENKAPPVKNF